MLSQNGQNLPVSSSYKDSLGLQIFIGGSSRTIVLWPYFVENQKRFPCLEQHNRPLTNCCNDPVHREADPEPILLASMITAPIRWHLVEEIIQAQRYEMPPPECPPMLQYVPNALRQCTMEWVLITPSSSQLGFQRTIQLLQNTFWWPSLAADTKR